MQQTHANGLKIVVYPNLSHDYPGVCTNTNLET